MFKRILFIIFFIILPFSLKAEMGFWNKLLFSDKNYAKNIEITSFIVTQDQVCTTFCNPKLTIKQLSNDELFGQPAYLLFQVKNKGSKRAWGILAFTVPSFHHEINIPIPDIENNAEFQFYLFYLGQVVSPDKPAGAPQITYKWKSLYTK